MKHWIAALMIAALPAGSAGAEPGGDTGLTALMTAYQARGWEGVGRLNIGLYGMCTGALIEPGLVLTAGHCLYDRFTGELVDPAEIRFLAGWRNGRASASRGVRRAIVHPEYSFEGAEGALRVANDIALLELDSAIRLSNVRPFAIGARPAKGSSVGVVSYAQGRADSPSLEEVCHVLARQRGALVLSCDVDFGASGAPIFVEQDGEMRIVSVMSAMAKVRGRDVSLGTGLADPLEELRALLDAGAGSFRRSDAARRLPAPEVSRGGAMRARRGGAKFLRP